MALTRKIPSLQMVLAHRACLLHDKNNSIIVREGATLTEWFVRAIPFFISERLFLDPSETISSERL
jgi:hypothetical protein